jgi:Zn-dependent protease
MPLPPPKPACGLPAGPDGPFGTGGRAGGLAITGLAGVLGSGFFSSVTFSSYGYHIAMITDYSIQAVAINAIPLIFAITIHEAAHGYAARRFGDNTAYMLGRVSLNPAKHIDPVGTILIPLMLILAGSPFLVGYAKPVPVNFGRLRNPRIDSIWVALAGPGSNFVQALIWACLLIILLGLGIDEKFLISMSQAGILWNLGLLVFNLFPIPPLDGGRILAGLLPARQSIALGKLEPWGFFIVLALVFTGIIGSLWMEPLMAFFRWALHLITLPLQMLF